MCEKGRSQRGGSAVTKTLRTKSFMCMMSRVVLASFSKIVRDLRGYTQPTHEQEISWQSTQKARRRLQRSRAAINMRCQARARLQKVILSRSRRVSLTTTKIMWSARFANRESKSRRVRLCVTTMTTTTWSARFAHRESKSRRVRLHVTTMTTTTWSARFAHRKSPERRRAVRRASVVQRRYGTTSGFASTADA